MDDCRLKQYVRSLLLDFSKAFNHIDHIILITKLHTIYHLSEFIVTRIAVFLTDKHQHVWIRQHKPNWLAHWGRSPQDTLLGVVHFTLMIGDMPWTCHMVRYVHDTMEHAIHVYHHNSTGKMQEVTNNTRQWSRDNNMATHYTKTKDMIISFSQEHINIHSEKSPVRPMLLYSTNYWHQFWVQFVM